MKAWFYGREVPVESGVDGQYIPNLQNLMHEESISHWLASLPGTSPDSKCMGISSACALLLSRFSTLFSALIADKGVTNESHRNIIINTQDIAQSRKLMSLVKRNSDASVDLELAQELLDLERLSSTRTEHSTSITLVQGHFYYNPRITNSGGAQSTLGDLGTMANNRRANTDLAKIRAVTPPPSDIAYSEIDHTTPRSMPTMEDDPPAPPQYMYRDPEFFRPGRLLKMWAPKETEFHKKEFVLIDTQNIQGPGFLVHRYSEEEESQAGRGYSRRSHVLILNHAQREDTKTAKRKVVYMDEFVDEEIDDRTWVELEHQYTIPFVKYKCVDCGVLDRLSMKDLRRYYVEWLRYHWMLD